MRSLRRLILIKPDDGRKSKTRRSTVKLLRNTTIFELLLLAVIAVVALFLSNFGLRAFACVFFCRRQWSLVDTDHMRYHQLNEWDRAMMELDNKTGFLSSSTQWVTHIDQERQVGGKACSWFHY
jgi:hypothetical protein